MIRYRLAPRRGGAGFTLLEVMVAFVIASLAAMILYKAGFSGAAAGATAARYDEAVVRAQSRMASIGTLTALRPVQASGDDGGGFYWQLRIAAAQSTGRLNLYDVLVTERFGNREVALHTKLLAAGR